MNQLIIDTLTKLRHYDNILGEKYKVKAFDTAINTIKKLHYEITLNNAKNLIKLEGIGNRILLKIIEVLETGKLQELQELQNNKVIKAYENLTKVLGIGPKGAKKLIDSNIYTVDDLKKAALEGKVQLTKSQILGIKYYKSLNERIPRDEVTVISSIIYDIINDVLDKPVINTVGSYRRGLKDCGDIDILVTTKRKFYKDFTVRLHDALNKYKNLYVDQLGLGETKYSFLIKSPVVKGKVRQIDVRYLPYESYYPAILYFTGSGVFNQRMRHIAKIKNMKLSEYELAKNLPGGKIERIVVHSEKEIFKVLGMKYLKPEERKM